MRLLTELNPGAMEDLGNGTAGVEDRGKKRFSLEFYATELATAVAIFIPDLRSNRIGQEATVRFNAG